MGRGDSDSARLATVALGSRLEREDLDEPVVVVSATCEASCAPVTRMVTTPIYGWQICHAIYVISI